MKNFKTHILYSVLSVLLGAGVTGPVRAQSSPLPSPTLVPTHAPMPVKKHKSVPKRKSLSSKKIQLTSTATAFPTTTPTPAITTTPIPTPTAGKPPTHTPTPNRTASPVPTPKLPAITTIPNPAYGDKVIFRVMTLGPAKVQIVVYDRFFNKVKELQGEGERLFDVLWNFKKIPQGIYYYQAQITDTATGGPQMLKMQSFAVLKDDAFPDDP